MDDTQRIVKCGALSLHSAGGFFKKRWHSKYLVLYDGSKSGVKRLELFDSEIKFKKQNPAKIIPLVDCVRVVTCQRQKSSYTFEVRTSDQFYLLAAQSFQDMNDWVNCLRLVAFGQSSSSAGQVIQQATAASQAVALMASNDVKRAQLTNNVKRSVDVLLEKRQTASINQQVVATTSAPAKASLEPTGKQQVVGASTNDNGQPQAMTASQAAAAAATALAKTRQRQPSLLGSCKPQPPNDSPFIQQQQQQQVNRNSVSAVLSAIGQIDTLTPTVRGQLISTASKTNMLQSTSNPQAVQRPQHSTNKQTPVIQATLDEEEENMLYCSIEDNPSEHNYRVKVIETELSLRCQLKCYQLTAPTTISQQYEQLGQFSAKSGAYIGNQINSEQAEHLLAQPVTFYQLIIGPQELTLLNDYAAASLKQQSTLRQQQQGLWSWPYQCIRRYGFDKDNCFMFEAGRKCTSGPGQFIVQTPKAYQIYQDVVKFVNELRSLNNTTSEPLNESRGNNLMEAHLEEQRQKMSQSVVTQIPVTWTPQITSMSTEVTVADTRQQFFDTLRQLDFKDSSSSSSSALPPSSGTIVQQVNTKNNHESSNLLAASQEAKQTANRLDHQHQQQQLQTAPSSTSSSPIQLNSTSISSVKSTSGNKMPDKLLKSNSPVGSLPSAKCDTSPNATSEETDESGYEQGDDSVDSGSAASRLLKLSSSATRKRQANDSMSSSSSTTSSSGGSPGHSVSRRSSGNGNGIGGANFNTQGPSKRPLLNTSSNVSGTSQNQAQNAIKPAVTRSLNKSLSAGKILGLPKDFMDDDRHEDFETNLIRDVYSEITKLHAKFAVTSGSTEDLMSSNSSNAGSSDNFSGGLLNEQDNESNTTEPMYSNLSAPISNSLQDQQHTTREKSRVRRLTDYNLDDEERENIHTKSHDKFSNQLKPQQQQQQQQQGFHERSPLHNSYPMINNFDYLSSQPQPPQLRGQMYTTMLNPIPEISEVPTPKSHNSNAVKGRTCRMGLSTNHYVINDVQYAKISKNI